MSIYRFKRIFPIAVCALLFAACKEAPISDPVAEAAAIRNHFNTLRAGLDAKYPGRGVTDYPGNTVEDIPKSYAMVLMAELELQRKTGSRNLSAIGLHAGNWLLDHADENKDRVIGWGVPVAWDAYGDNSVNPAHTEYTISTAIAIHALLDWMESSPRAPRVRIMRTIEQSIAPYLANEMRTPAGMLPYSLQTVDRLYDTFNPAAYLAGQLQRYSVITKDRIAAEKIREAADATMQALLDNRKISSDTGAWYWNYSIQENTPNDLPHAGYIVDGIRTYIAHGGRLAAQFDREMVIAHLRDFPDHKSSMIRAWPRFKKNITLPARSYDLGMAMYLVCTEPGLAALRTSMVNVLPAYRLDNGHYLKYPANHKEQTPLIVQEYEAYLMRGTITCVDSKSLSAEQATLR